MPTSSDLAQLLHVTVLILQLNYLVLDVWLATSVLVDYNVRVAIIIILIE